MLYQRGGTRVNAKRTKHLDPSNVLGTRLEAASRNEKTETHTHTDSGVQEVLSLRRSLDVLRAHINDQPGGIGRNDVEGDLLRKVTLTQEKEHSLKIKRNIEYS